MAFVRKFSVGQKVRVKKTGFIGVIKSIYREETQAYIRYTEEYMHDDWPPRKYETWYYVQFDYESWAKPFRSRDLAAI